MNQNFLDELFGDAGVRIAIIGVLAILALFLFAKTWAAVDGIGEVNTSGLANITVTGTGKAAVAPTIATITFTVQESAQTTAAAQDAATKRTNTALAAIKKLGVADGDVQTSGYTVSPQYETKPCAPNTFCPQNTNKIIGYEVSQTITVKVRDTNKTGDVLSALGQAGVQNVSGPNFAVDDTAPVEAEARGKAIADARQKAQTLAAQLGVRLGRVIGFSENSSPVPYFAYGVGGGASSKAADVVAPSVPVGQNETTVNVTVVYEIR